MIQRKKDFQSKSMPGASFCLRYINAPLRNRTELGLVEQRHEQRMLAQEHLSIIPAARYEDQAAIDQAFQALSPKDKSRLQLIHDRAAILNQSVKLGFASTVLVSFKLPDQFSEIESNEELFEYGPETESLVNEISEEAEPFWSLSSADSKNSSRPSTSPEVADGPISDTTVEPVNSETTTDSATAS